MTLTLWGALLGLGAGVGLASLARVAAAARRPSLAERVLPYVRDLPTVWHGDGAVETSGFARPVLDRWLRSTADRLDRVLGGNASVRRRLDRANLAMTVHDFRVEQVLWGVASASAFAGLALLVALQAPARAVPVLVLCAAAFACGALLRENRLTAQVTARERRIMVEFPTVAELMALAVAAGEGPVAALDRVARRTHGELAADLDRVLAQVRTGVTITAALDDLAARTGLPVVARFAEAMAVAIERGTPLADVLHAQAADVREAGRRALIESGARREVLMMVPVVFLVLPVTVLFAFWPGLVGLRLVTP